MAYDIDGSGTVQLHEYIRGRAAEYLLRRSSARRSQRGLTLSRKLAVGK